MNDTAPEFVLTEARDSGGDKPFGRSTVIRCLLALICSHVAAPYSAARFTIRYHIGGGFEISQAVFALLAILAGAVLSYRQLAAESTGRRLLYGATLLVLWFIVSLCLLKIASDSAIPLVLLAACWSLGTLWVAWLVWGLCFFSTTGFAVGLICVSVGATVFWSLIDITGLTGDAKVEFAWHKPAVASESFRATDKSRIESLGETVWNQYLGNDRTGSVSDIEWNPNWNSHPPKEHWRCSCGRGWSSFAATESICFTQEQIDGKDSVTARSLTDGRIVWTVAEQNDGFRSTMGGDGPRATPTLHRLSTEGQAGQIVVIAAGPTGVLSCLNANSGDMIWQVDLSEKFSGENLTHGVCASPLVVEDTVIACPASPDGPCLAAFALATGDVVWTCDSDWRSSYASPQLMNLSGTDQIVLHASPGVIAVSPDDGSVLWQYDFTNEWDNNATQPLSVPGSSSDLIVATGYQGGAARLSVQVDSNGEFQVTEIWVTRSTMKTRFCNMALFGNVIVGLDNGILCGVDLTSGKRLWKEGRFGHGQMLKVADRLVVVEERGRVHLMQPDESGHHPLGTIEALDRKTWNHPILAGQRLLIRNDREIVCFQISDSVSR